MLGQGHVIGEYKHLMQRVVWMPNSLKPCLSLQRRWNKRKQAKIV